MVENAACDVPANWRNRKWRYRLQPNNPEGLGDDINLNPALTLAQLFILDTEARKVVHENMERSEDSIELGRHAG